MTATETLPGILRTIPLPGNRTLTIRPERPEDAPGLADLYDRMPDDDRYCRFFTARRPPDAFVKKMARVFERGGVGIVAETRDGPEPSRLVGEASYELLPNGDGELGIAVASGARGWLGPYLLHLLLEQAAARGVPNLEAEVLMGNRRMMAVLRARGMVVLDHFQSPATLRVAIATTGPVPAWPASHDRPRILVEVPGGQWVLAEEMERRGFQVVACPGPDRGGPPCGPLAGRRCPLASQADAIVVVRVPGGSGDVLLEAHRRLHPNVPVCVSEPVAEAAGPGDATVGSVELPADAVAAGDLLEALTRRAPEVTLAPAVGTGPVPTVAVDPGPRSSPRRSGR